jgi:hypothetical protein
MVYRCRIELNEIEPKIWREFQFHPDVTFHQLHKIIQTVMGWENYHLYEFHVDEKVIGLPDPTFADLEDREILNARREIVQKHVHEENSVFTYVYDFGDDWRHTITLLKIDATATDPAPLCLDGARCCPLEDVGGVWGHQHLMEALFTPDHPERDHFMDWVPEDYEPEYFSCEEVNQELERQKDKLLPKSLANRPALKKPVKLTKTALNKHLKQLNHSQLIDLVKACYGYSKEMEKFLAVKMLGDEAAESLFQEYRKKVEKAFFPERGLDMLKLREAIQTIAEFERLTENGRHALELKLICVENGVDFTLRRGVMDELFCISLALLYGDIIEQINDDETAEWFDEFEERLEAVVSKSAGISREFHDQLAELHAQIRWI